VHYRALLVRTPIGLDYPTSEIMYASQIKRRMKCVLRTLGFPCYSCGVLTHSNLVKKHVDAVQAGGESAACCRSHIGQCAFRRAGVGPMHGIHGQVQTQLRRAGCGALLIFASTCTQRSESSREGSTKPNFIEQEGDSEERLQTTDRVGRCA
jgi:hypothetical protein